MTTRATGPGAGFRWLISAVNLGSRNARAIFGAAALLVVMALIPSAVQLALGAVAGDSSFIVLAGVGLSLLYSLIVMPPLIGGFLRLIHSAETGQPTRPTDLFALLQDRAEALRMIGLMLLMLAFVVLVIVVFGLIFGVEFLNGLITMMQDMENMQGQANPQMPAIPDGFGTFVGLAVLLGLFLNGLYSIAVGQVALGRRPVFGAFGDGIVGTAKNLLPLLVLLIVVIVAGFLAMLVIGLVAMIIGFIGGMIHPVVAVVLIAPIYIGLMIAIYVISFGIMYYMWRDICGDGIPAAPVDARDDHVAM